VTSEVQTASPQLRASSEAAQRQLSREVEAKADVAALRSEVGQLKKAVDAQEPPKQLPEAAQKQRRSPRAAQAAVPPQQTRPQAPPAAPKLDSLILLSFPPLFDEFRGKRFVLLWRGSRDGFGARGFHGRCDGHANTLTLILDTKKNVFGAFTPLEWESGSYSYWKSDDILKSFVFTVKNPHKIRAKKFAMKADQKQYAIYCDSSCGPSFGDSDIAIPGQGSANTCFGNTYANDTGLDGKTLFAGSADFKVKEIEVFEITDVDQPPGAPQPSRPQAPPAPGFDSVIVPGVPALFGEFRGKRFALLWRGGRDGFGARDFRGRCDGHANTLTLILDTDRNVFGSFTPLQWESRGGFKINDSQNNFLFTLNNSRTIPAMKFALKAKNEQEAIWYYSSADPVFGGSDGGIVVCNDCNANTRSRACLGSAYTNGTGQDGDIVFTGSLNFQVREIEVFEITD
jgi:hypothetical protein